MDRIANIVSQENLYVSEQMLKLLESEIEYAVKNFVVIASPVKVRYCKSDGQLKFMVEFNCSRVRPLGFVPGK